MIRGHVVGRRVAGWSRPTNVRARRAPPLNLSASAASPATTPPIVLIDAANATGEVLFTRSVLEVRSVLRFCIGGRTTQRHHVEAGWGLLRHMARRSG